MVQIIPFIGCRYRVASDYDLSNKVAPPYDVINATLQANLYDRDPCNIVRLILGKRTDADTEQDNAYTRANKMLKAWLDNDVLIPESHPAIYAYTQTWEGITRRGFIAALRLEPFETGHVLPHEYTLGGPKADRLALTRATQTTLSPIFGIYQDEQLTIEAKLFSEKLNFIPTIKDDDGVVHKFWPVIDPEVISSIQAVMKNKTVLIADGHHRYETALAYQAEKSPQADGKSPTDYTMCFFTNMAEPGLRIYPTHRILTSLPAGWSRADFLSALETAFEPCSHETALFFLESQESGKKPYQLKSGVDLSMIPAVLQTLDVAIIDALVFQGILKQSANDLKQAGHLLLLRDEAEIEALRLENPDNLIFWVGAPSVQLTRTVCESGYRMPQKSTYFYPKLLSGLVIYPHALQAHLKHTVMAASASA